MDMERDAGRKTEPGASKKREKPFRIGLVCCSNGLPEQFFPSFERLLGILQAAGIEAVFGKHLFASKEGRAGGTARERAEDLMGLLTDRRIRAVFDLSGGDLANEILPWLDFEEIGRACRDSGAEEEAKGAGKMMFGYSDLTCVLNAIYEKTGCPCGLYQLRNLLYSHGEEQLAGLLSLLGAKEKTAQAMGKTVRPLTDLRFRFLRGTFMEGTAAGGNIRCLLKLAGTPYFPDLRGRILILEANSGGPDKLSACLAQLAQMGVFDMVSGILAGTFTEMEKRGLGQEAARLILSYAGNLPVAATDEIGHGSGARCAVIGRTIRLDKAEEDTKWQL